jgi:putative transposase
MGLNYNPQIHHRRSIRLKGYNYGQVGLYFITICTWHRRQIFGTIEAGEMRLNALGTIARDEWFHTAQMRPNIDLAEFVVMPNHIHGIIAIVSEMSTDQGRGTLRRAPTDPTGENQIEAFGKPTSNTIPTIVRGYKAAVTKQINILRDCPGCPVWQRNYYEHVVRSEADYLRIAAYILDNPRRWHEDSLNRAE